MKKLMIFVVFLVFFEVFALKCGDELKSDLKINWVTPRRFNFIFPSTDRKNEEKLKILICAQLNAEDFSLLLPLVNRLWENKSLDLGFLVRSEAEIKTFLSKNPTFKYPIGYDNAVLRSCMENNIIYPRVFVLNYQNKIIWCGELIDLPEMVESFSKKTFDAEKAAKISKYLDEIQSAMREGNDFKAAGATADILKLDPANTPALRMRLFMLENTRRVNEAWELLEKQRKIVPNEKKIYLLELDLASRYSSLSSFAANISKEFVSRKLGDADENLLLAWALLSSYPFDYEAIDSAALLVKYVEARQNELNSDVKSRFYGVKALLFYRRGDLPGAVAAQLEALNLSDNSENRRMLKYYQSVGKK